VIFSVYNYDTHGYDYYEGSGPKGTHAGTPPMRKPRSELGATPEQAAWLVPSGSRKVGSGELPQGRIASLSGSEDSTADPVQLGMYALIAYLLWKAIR
jgi:hypothetical protein